MSHDLNGWTPIRASYDGAGLVVDWCFTEGIAFDDPFFDQTVERCLRHPFRLLFRRTTPIEALGELAIARGRPLPSGLVLHLSRSGSTLVAQMLARRPDTHVISEAGPLDAVIRAPAPMERRAEWLRWMAAALNEPDGARPHYVLKLDAWAALDLPLLALAFPGVPWAFVYRDPVEVLVSQQRRPGYHMMPFGLPPSAVGLDPQVAAGMSIVEHGAAVLGRIATCVTAAADDPLALLVNYDELPAATVDRIARHFGMPVDGTFRATMLEAVHNHVKNGVLPFADDRVTKQQAAGDDLRAAAERWVVEPYRKLERIRTGNR
ncbi:MAG: sulfotransferase family protein [Frankiaceae bacterium]